MPSDLTEQAGNAHHQLAHYHPPADFPWVPVFVDEHLLVVDKPAGLLSVPGRGPHVQDCLIHRVNLRYPQALVVHRLDMATSGLIVFGLNQAMQKSLSQLFMLRQVKKIYQALVHGQPQPVDGFIDLPLMVDWVNRPRQMVDKVNGKPSQTGYQTVAYDKHKNTSRLQLMPITGRSHQLRVHCMSIGHPILGDVFYGSEPMQAHSATEVPRLMLHATDLLFQHPVTNQPLHLQSECPF